ncbi:MAG: sporulation protein YqfD [Firmicutes bacterium]|nr:sporulation protein YqfD [Bacillota bacterium]
MRTKSIGYVKFSIIGTECERFITEAINQGITIYDVENCKGIFYAKAYPKDYILLSKLKRGFYVRLKIVERHGIWFRLNRYKERYGLLMGAAAYGLTVFLCSTVIWDITITGNQRIPNDSILDFLSQNGIYAGASRKGISNTVTELNAQIGFDDLAWISIESEGSRINVKLNERIANPKNGIPVSTPCNIVSAKDGIIVNAVVNRGTLLYEIGSGIVKDSVIVSGIVKDGAGNVSVQHADAEIIAEFQEEVSFYKEFNTIEQVKTEETYTKEYIRLFGFTVPQNKAEYPEGYIYSSDSYQVNILGLRMPWTRLVVNGTKTEDVEVKRTVNDVKRLLQQEFEQYERNFFVNYKIMDKEITYERDENGMKATCKYTLQGDVAEQSEIFYRENQ